ncbi:MAG: hypothetical protein Q7V17_12040 [Afipia sp.]|nr:hypothetical protein [Afipia sp.]
MVDQAKWHPGSFTKNFSWGANQGLLELHEIIRIGFAGELSNVPRHVFRERIKRSGRPDFIPINFFLFNQIRNGTDFLLVDELVFQALKFDHSERFDHLALYTFMLSLVGTWRGAEVYQERPALWAHHYVGERINRSLNWDMTKVSADDIEKFVLGDSRYVGQTGRKLATNLNFLFRIGGLSKMMSRRVDRWWTDAIFLTLDRSIETRRFQNQEISQSKYESYLFTSGFSEISGPRSTEKDLAVHHVVRLFAACGARDRFNDESVQDLAKTQLLDIENWLANSQDPVAALHPTNFRIIKTIPRACAILAHYAGFALLDLDQLAEANLPDLVRENLEKALLSLKGRGIKPTISAEELMKLMRGE